MKNPPNVIALIEFTTISIISIIIGAFFITSYVTKGGALIILVAGIGILVAGMASVSAAIISEGFFRAIDVEVGEVVTIRWRFNRVQELPFESITDLLVDPKAPKSFVTRWQGGSIGIDGRWIRFGISYEIVMAIRDGYFKRLGHYPPLPSWYSLKRNR